MFVPYPTSMSSRIPAGQWHEEQDQGQRPSTTASGDHPEHSLHFRSRSSAHAQSPRRLSVFSGRSRSNTTTSTSSSRRSAASSMTSTDVSSLRSQDDRTASTAGTCIVDKQESVAKSLLSRGSRILRRQGSKFSISTTLDEEDETDRERPRFEVSELFSRSHKSRESDAHEQFKRIISDPFDFHHLTHTSPAQFQSLDNASKNELVTEFSAIRAAQKPVTELKGIRAEDIHFRNFSSEDWSNRPAGETGRESQYVSAISPPISPGTSAPTSPSRSNLDGVREGRTVENFSRPVSRHQNVPSSPSIIPPPRVSSKLACSPELSEPAPPPQAIDEILGLGSPSTYPDFVYFDEVDDTSSLSRIDLAEFFRPGLRNSVINADDIAKLNRASPATVQPSDLEDVPEEEEATFWRESSEHSSRPSTSRSSVHLEHQPSIVSTNAFGPNPHLSVHVMDGLSTKFSDALGSPTLPQHHAMINESPISEAEDIRRKFPSGKGTVVDDSLESWDDDIDYCYEHAAESNCNFDWHRKSLEEPEGAVPAVSLTTSESMDKPVEDDRKGGLHPLYISHSGLTTPDLDPGSAQSLLTAQEAVTPSTSGDGLDFLAHAKRSAQDDYFRPVGAQLLPSTLGKEMMQDTLYEEFLTADGASDRHFSFCSQRGSQSLEPPVSPRSSCSPISKCNSQESIILSRAASIVRKHRSSISTISVPELVHSASGSREFTAQEHFGLIEHSNCSALSPGAMLNRPGSSPRHRQTKSLIRDVTSHSALEIASSNGSADVADMSYPVVVPTHDRAKSTSAVETDAAASTMKADGLPFAMRMQSAALNKGVGGKKARTSYSLFPSGPACRRPS